MKKSLSITLVVYQCCLSFLIWANIDSKNKKCTGFAVHYDYRPRYDFYATATTTTFRRQSSSSNEEKDNNNNSMKKENNMVGNNGSTDDEELFRQQFFPSSSNEEDDSSWDQELEQINIENVKQKLEESHRQSFLKSKPWKLPYLEASQWVQKNLGANTKEEFEDFVANGNVRTPYIPKRPEQFYTERGTWISWEHFLNHKSNKKNKSDDNNNNNEQ